MEESIFKYVLDYGGLGVMSGLLFWLYLQNTKQLEKIRQQAREDEEKIRDRFALVISKYDQEREKFLDEKTLFRTQLSNQIDNLEKTIGKQDDSLQNIKERIDQLLLKNNP